MAEKDEVLGEQAPNGSNEETRPLNVDEKMAEHHDGDVEGDAEGEQQENGCSKAHACMTCMKEAPYCSFMALLLILFGGVGLALGSFLGSVRMRTLIDNSSFLMYIEYIGIGAAGGIVLYAILVYVFICVSTRSSLVCCFGTHGKRMCAFLLNYVFIVFTFILILAFLLIVVLLTLPAAFHGVAYYNVNWNRTDCLDLRHYAVYPASSNAADMAKVKYGCGEQASKMRDFINNANITLLCSLTALAGGLLITLGLAWLMACLSARIPYLRPPCIAKCAHAEVNDPLCNEGGNAGQGAQQCGAPDGGSFEVRL